MEIKISLNENADLHFIKKLLSELKGIKNIEILKTDSTPDQQYDDLRNLLLEESKKQSAEGKTIPYSPELLNQIFK